jgi:hypothetical protein
MQGSRIKHSSNKHCMAGAGTGTLCEHKFTDFPLKPPICCTDRVLAPHVTVSVTICYNISVSDFAGLTCQGRPGRQHRDATLHERLAPTGHCSNAIRMLYCCSTC